MRTATARIALLTCLLLGLSPGLHAQTLIADIWPGGESSAPKEFANAEGTVFFAADDGATGIELWKSDGTPDGTRLVKDINPTGHSEPSWITAVGDRVFFRADDGVHGEEIWVSDGTEEGTYLTRDVWEGPTGSHPEQIGTVGGFAYYMASDADHGAELWRSDGTTTEMVMDINPGPGDSNPHWPATAKGFMYFRADDGAHGEELWRTNGTVTELVMDINPGADGSHPERLVAMGPYVFFPANDGRHGTELWRSNGNRTRMLDDVFPGPDSGEPKQLTVVGRQLFFAAEDGLHGSELWVSDGHPNGARLVRDIRSGDAPSLPDDLTAVGDRLMFNATNGQTLGGTALWISDGTFDGTVRVKDVRDEGEPAFQHFVASGGLLYFTANDGEHGVELWRSNGTPNGTFLLRDISDGAAGATPLFLTDAEGVLFFSATDGLNGRELWTYDASVPPLLPDLRDDEALTETGIPVEIDVLANDLGDGLVVAAVAAPANGTAVLASGGIVYTPAPGFVGTDVFTYTAEDLQGDAAQATVTVTVIFENTPPTISAIPDQTMRESSVLEEVSLTIGDAETPARELLVVARSSNQVLVPDGGLATEGGSSHRALTIRPTPDMTGDAVITVTVSDGLDETSVSFLLTVYPWEIPTLTAITDPYVYEGMSAGPLAFTIADGDTPAADLIVTAESDAPALLPPDGIVLAGRNADRLITVTPAPGMTGDAVVTISVRDTDGNVGTGQFTLHVFPTGTVVAVPDAYVGIQDQEMIVPVEDGVLSNDLPNDGTPLTALLEAPPAEGLFTLNPDGSFVYGPVTGEHGGHDEPIVFSYRVTDGSMTSDVATVTITFEHGEGLLMSFVPDQETDANEAIGPIALTVRPGHAVITGTSSNPALFPYGSIVVDGSGPHNRGRQRTLTMTPAPNAYGTAVVTLTAVNEHGDGGHGLSEEGPAVTTQEILVVVRPIPGSPGPFALLQPDDGTMIVVEDDPTERVRVAWSPSVDPDGDPVRYTLTLLAEAGDEPTTFFVKETDKTYVEGTLRSLDVRLERFGVALGDSLALRVVVQASDGALVSTVEARTLTLIRGVATMATAPGSALLTDALPDTYVLGEPAPNPARTQARVRFGLPEGADVRLHVYTVTGREALTLVEGYRDAGWYTVDVPLGDLASGVYVYRIEAGDFVATQRMTVVR